MNIRSAPLIPPVVVLSALVVGCSSDNGGITAVPDRTPPTSTPTVETTSAPRGSHSPATSSTATSSTASSTTTTTPQTNVQVVESFADAFANYDADAADLVLADDVALPLYGEDDPAIAEVADVFDWARAAGWRWYDLECSEPEPTVVQCDLMVTDRLSDSIRVTAERPADAEFTVVDRQIVGIRHDIGHSRHVDNGGIEPSDGFWEWLMISYPNNASVMWADDLWRPAYNSESSRLLEGHLDEYLGINGARGDDVEVAHEFAAGVANAKWVEDGTELAIAPGTAEDGMVPPVAEQLEWLQAYGWRWSRTDCEEAAEEWIRCTFTNTNRLTDARGAGFDGSATVRVVGDVKNGGSGGVADLDWDADWGAFFDVEQAFIEFVRRRSPEDATAMWHADGTPIVSTSTALLLDAYLDDYLDQHPLEVVERFLAALDGYDLAAVRNEFTGGARWEFPLWYGTHFLTPSSMAWLEAWNWRIDVDDCDESDTAIGPWPEDSSFYRGSEYVICSARHSNLLTEAAGGPHTASFSFRLRHGRLVESMLRGNDDDETVAAAYDPASFYDWVAGLGLDATRRIGISSSDGTVMMWPELEREDLTFLRFLLGLYADGP